MNDFQSVSLFLEENGRNEKADITRRENDYRFHLQLPFDCILEITQENVMFQGTRFLDIRVRIKEDAQTGNACIGQQG